MSFIQKVIAKIALALAGDKVKKGLIVLGAAALAYNAQYPGTELSGLITHYVLPVLGLLGIASGGTTGLQPPAVSAALGAAKSPASVQGSDLPVKDPQAEVYDPFKIG